LGLVGLFPGPLEGGAQGLEFGDATVDVLQVLVEEADDEGAGLLSTAVEVEDVLDLLQAEVECLGLADEGQERDLLLRVEAVAGVVRWGGLMRPWVSYRRMALAVSPVRAARSPMVSMCLRSWDRRPCRLDLAPGVGF
jgi:hypothetical protein